MGIMGMVMGVLLVLLGIAAVVLSSLALSKTVSISNDIKALEVPQALEAAQPARFGVCAIMINALSNTVIASFRSYGVVTDTMPEIKAICVYTTADGYAAIQARPDVQTAELDVEIPAPVNDAEINMTSTLSAEDIEAAQLSDVEYLAALNPPDFVATGASTWWTDQMNAVSFGNPATSTTPDYTGDGVYVFVHDTGLVTKWRSFFPVGRIDTQYAAAVVGGQGVAKQIVKNPASSWSSDTNGHGTVVTACIIGHHITDAWASSFGPVYGGVSGDVAGVAPRATIVPIKIYPGNGRAFDSVHAASFLYTASLKAPGGPLYGKSVIINYSSNTPVPTSIQRAAVQYAISVGVIFVAAAGNLGSSGMGWPGAYPEAISAGAIGVSAQLSVADWAFAYNVPEPTAAADNYVPSFSSRQLAGQQLDVLAPGVYVLMPFMNLGQSSAVLSFWSGTSFSSPLVSATVALMLEKTPSLTQVSVESILKSTATPMTAPSCRLVTFYSGVFNQCWNTNAVGSGMVDVLAAVTAA